MTNNLGRARHSVRAGGSATSPRGGQRTARPTSFASLFVIWTIPVKIAFIALDATLRAMKMLELNHVAIHVADMERSNAFYRDVLRLEPMPRPAFDFPGAWFRLGLSQELHLIGRRGPVALMDGNNHFALRVEDIAPDAAATGRCVADFLARPGRAFRRAVHLLTAKVLADGHHLRTTTKF